MPVARQRARAPAALRPWVVIRERRAGIVATPTRFGPAGEAGARARDSPGRRRFPMPVTGARPTVGGRSVRTAPPYALLRPVGCRRPWPEFTMANDSANVPRHAPA